MPLQIGLSRADITPPIGIPMVGYAGRGVSTDIHDPLRAMALVSVDGDATHLLIVCDLLQLRTETVAEYREAIHAASGVAPERITISCTHTHYGPSVDRNDDPITNGYRENLKHQLAGIARASLNKLRPRLGIGRGTCDIAINRREKRPDGVIVLGNNPDGPVDRELIVVKFEGESGEPIACLVNFACHPVSQASQMTALSADFPGRARDMVEEATGVPCLYLQGACGDLNPVRRMVNAYEPARASGVRLGGEIIEALNRIETREASGVEVASTTVALPRYMYGSQGDAEMLAVELESQVARMEAQDPNSGSLWWAKLRHQRVSEAVESWKSGQPLDTVEAELQAWRVGGIAFTSAPGEIFTENGALVKRESPHGDTLFLGYTNGSIGYVPTRDAYPEGGYEVTHACQVDPDAGDMINNACLDVLNRLG